MWAHLFHQIRFYLTISFDGEAAQSGKAEMADEKLPLPPPKILDLNSRYLLS